MRKSISIFILALVFTVGLAQPAASEYVIFSSPLTMTTGDPNITIRPRHGGPSSAVSVFSDLAGDQYWVDIGLTLPSNVVIQAVVFGYELEDYWTFITETRLTEMLFPDEAFVIHEDDTDVHELSGTPYSSLVVPNENVEGTITLSIRLAFSGAGHYIYFGYIALLVSDIPSAIEDGPSLAPDQQGLLGQNYPNPFNPSTAIEFALERPKAVGLSVYSLDGNLISSMINANLAAGPHKVSWDGLDGQGRKVASGVYVYRLQIGNVIETRKMTLIR